MTDDVYDSDSDENELDAAASETDGVPEESEQHGETRSHVVTREDGRRFVVGCTRESLPASMPKRVKTNKVNAWRDLYDTTALAGYTAGSATHYIFSSAQGYALGESVRDHFKAKGPVVWAEPDPESGDYFVVILDADEVLADGILPAGTEELPDDVLSGIMAVSESVGDGEELPVHHFGDPPVAITSALLEYNIDCSLLELDESILEQLKPDNRYQLRPFGDAMRSLTASKGPGLFTKVAGVVGVLAVGAGAFYMLEGEEGVARVIDRYSEYRAHLEKPTASSVLEELFFVMRASQASEHWAFKSCEYTGGRELLCELQARPGARGAELNTLSTLLERDVNATLMGGAAVATIQLRMRPRQGDYVIPNRESAVTAVRDRITVASRPTSIVVQQPIQASNWSRQAITLQYPETGLHTFIQLSSATRQMPAHLTAARIESEAGQYEIETVVSVFGAR
jgi:hypothetical protein|tara:strand:+ start:572 stop:1939 length:1368 start_codon:yes stop_codon:yes gene_type:complete